jgi:hypothetical protein
MKINLVNLVCQYYLSYSVEVVKRVYLSDSNDTASDKWTIVEI